MSDSETSTLRSIEITRYTEYIVISAVWRGMWCDISTGRTIWCDISTDSEIWTDSTWPRAWRWWNPATWFCAPGLRSCSAWLGSPLAFLRDLSVVRFPRWPAEWAGRIFRCLSPSVDCGTFLRSPPAVLWWTPPACACSTPVESAVRESTPASSSCLVTRVAALQVPFRTGRRNTVVSSHFVIHCRTSVSFCHLTN